MMELAFKGLQEAIINMLKDVEKNVKPIKR